MSSLYLRHVVATALLATILVAPLASALLQPPLLFGQSCVLTGPNAFLGTRMAAGIQAAFLEVNRNGGAGGRNLSLITYDDGYNPAPALSNTVQLLDVDGVFALIGYVGTPTSLAALPAAVARSVPFIGAFTGSNGLRKPFNPLTVNLRASYDDETAAIAQLLVGKYSLHRIACFYQNDTFGAAGLNGINRALNSIGLPLVATGLYTRNTVDVAAGLASIAAAGNIQAVVMIGSYSALAQFVQQAKNNSGFTPGCRFISVSFVGSEALASALPVQYRSNVFVTQVVPSPTDTAGTVAAAKYGAAMLAYEGAAAMSLDYASFEGYLAGRFAAAVVNQLPVLTRAAMLSVIQQQGLFLVDDLPYGLFSPSCATAVAAAALGCDCTQGARRVWTTQLQVDGSWAQIDNTFKWDLPTCFSPTSLVVAPMSFVASFPVNSTYGQMVSNGIAAAFTASNARNIAAGRSLVLQVRPYASGTPLSESSAINTMLADVYASGILGGTATSATAALVGTPILGRLDASYSSAISDAYAEVQRQLQHLPSSSADNGTVLMLTPPLQEQILALCQAAVSKWGAEFSMVVAVNASSMDAAQTIVSAALAATVYGATAPTMVALPLVNAPDSDSLLLLSDSAADLQSALALLRSGTLRSLLLPINSAATLMSVVASNSTSIPTATAKNILIARQFDDLAAGSSTFLETEYALDTTTIANATKRNPAFQQGYLMGRFVAALIARNSGALVGASEFLDLIYRSSTIAIDALTFGPFVLGGVDNCQQGISTFPVQSLDGAWIHRFTRGASCHANFVPIAAPPTTAPAYWAIGVGLGALLVIATVLVYAVRRHVRLAARPLDGSAPFAVMFVGVKNEAEVRDLGEANANAALGHIRQVVKDGVREACCFEARRMDDATVMIVAKNAESLLDCAAQIARAMDETDWSLVLVHKKVVSMAKKRSSHRGTNARRTTMSGSMASTVKSAIRVTSNLSRGTSRMSNSDNRVPSTNESDATAAALQAVPLLNIGLHFGFGMIEHDLETEIVSYHGAVVTRAATTADAAGPSQILVTREVVDAVEENGGCPRLGVFKAQDGTTPRDGARAMETSTNAPALTFVPHGLSVMYQSSSTFDRKKSQRFESGGIATALATADAGLARRRVAVVSIHIPTLEIDTDNIKDLSDVLTDVRNIVAEHKGTVLGVSGAQILVGINCIGPILSQPGVRAAAMGRQIVSTFHDEEVSIGIAVGSAVVANDVCLGPLRNTAEITRLAAAAAQLPIAAAGPAFSELDSKYQLYTIDCVAMPTLDGTSGSVCRMYAVLDEIVANEEWLYAMDKKEHHTANEAAWSGVISDSLATPVTLREDLDREVNQIRSFVESQASLLDVVAALTATMQRFIAIRDSPYTGIALTPWQSRYTELVSPWRLHAP